MPDKSLARRRARPLAHSKARGRLSQARAYLADLKAWRGGDDNRFGRMVDGRGKQLGDAEQWAVFILRILEDADVWTYQHGVAKRIARDMQRLGFSMQPAASDD